MELTNGWMFGFVRKWRLAVCFQKAKLKTSFIAVMVETRVFSGRMFVMPVKGSPHLNKASWKLPKGRTALPGVCIIKFPSRTDKILIG